MAYARWLIDRYELTVDLAASRSPTALSDSDARRKENPMATPSVRDPSYETAHRQAWAAKNAMSDGVNGCCTSGLIEWVLGPSLAEPAPVAQQRRGLGFGLVGPLPEAVTGKAVVGNQ
jgi:hypothetical protein